MLLVKLLAEKLYAARLARETCAADFLPLYDHLLNLAVNDAKRGYPQSAGRLIAKCRKLIAYGDPEIDREAWYYNRTRRYRAWQPFRYLTGAGT